MSGVNRDAKPCSVVLFIFSCVSYTKISKPKILFIARFASEFPSSTRHDCQVWEQDEPVLILNMTNQANNLYESGETHGIHSIINFIID